MASRRSLSRPPTHRSRTVPSTPDHEFDLLAVAARSAREPGMPPPAWPSDDPFPTAEILRAQQVPEPLVRRLADAAPGAVTRPLDHLAAALAATLRFVPLDEALRRPALLLLGPPGAGKTTFAAKLAAHLGERRVLVVSTDTRRTGAVAQLEEYTAVLGLPLAVAGDADALRGMVEGAAGRTVIVDTGGFGAEEAPASARLGALLAASRAEPILVLPADSAADEAIAMARHAATLGARCLAVTRLDMVRRIGGVLTAADAGRLALLAASVTPHFAYGLRALTPEVLARRLIAGALQEERWRTAAT